MKKRLFSTFLVAILCISAVVPVYAESEVQQKDTLQAVMSSVETRRVESYVLVQDDTTGEVTRIDFQSGETQMKEVNGQLLVTTTVDMNDIPQPRAGQTSTNTIDGWNGTVSITYTDNGTFACLTNTSGSWRRVSGSATLTNASVAYGQVLGTNSRNGYTPFGTTFSVATGFSAGKYGYGLNHFLGANIVGKINGKTATVVSNIYF